MSSVHPCVVSGCEQDGRNQIGVRCRVMHDGVPALPDKRKTYALFSVESPAYLCDHHALAGVSMILTVTPNGTEEAALAVICGRTMTDSRSVEIKQAKAA